MLQAAGSQLATTDMPSDGTGFKLDDAACQTVIAEIRKGAASQNGDAASGARSDPDAWAGGALRGAG